MTTPSLIVEIGFSAALTGTALHLNDTVRGIIGTNTIAADDLFADVTDYVTAVSTRRGATRADGPTLRYEAGTCTITFRNDDRRFDPSNLDGPYVAGGVTQVEPMRAVRIRATHDGHTWHLWRGFTDQWSVGYDGPNSSVASVTCFDALGVFAAHDRGAVAAVGAGETTGARINRILDGIDWLDEDRLISTGDETVQSTTLAGNVLTELLLTADTELGEFWVDTEGRAVFRSRTAGYTDQRSTYPLAHFGDEVDDGVTTTVNHATNPSLETNTSNGWGTIGTAAPTIARDSTRAMFGDYSLKVTWGAGGFLPGVVYDVAGLTAGRQYTISLYVYVPSGAPDIHLIAQSEWGTGNDGVYDQWVRLTWTGTATSTAIGLGIWPVTTPVGGELAWLDGIQVEEGPEATTYLDGDQDNCQWDGVPHGSVSRRLPELPYADVQLTYDALSITNTYRVAREGGTEQTVSDSGSVSAYLTRSHQRLDLMMQTDGEALIWAEQLIARTSLPELRVSALELIPSRDERLWAQALGREIGDRIRVTRRPPGGGDPFTRDAWVRGIEHQMTAELSWRTVLVLEQARNADATVDTFTRTVTDGWGLADSGEQWTIDADGSGGGPVASDLLIGVNAPRGPDWSDAVADYPGITYSRDFGADNIWPPADADSLTEPTKYGTGKMAVLPDAVWHLSWKDDPGLLEQWLDDLPNGLPANHPGFYLSPWHEPRDEVDDGDFTTAQFRAWGEEMSSIVAAHPNNWLIRGVGPILTRFDIDNAGANPADYGWATMDFFGVDCYWSTTTGGYPTTAQMFDSAFAAVHADWPGIDILIPEYGVYQQSTDLDGSGRAACITSHVEYLRTLSYVKAWAYFTDEGSLPGAAITSDSLEADAIRALLASQGTGGAAAGAADYSTTGTKGRLSLASVAAYREAWIPVGEVNVDVLVEGLTVSAAPTGGNCEVQVCARFDGDSYVDVRVFRRTDNTCNAAVRQVIDGVASSTSSFSTVPSATATSTLDVRLQAVGTTVRARAWVSGTTEPTSWLVTSTITHQTAGDVRYGAQLNTGNTNTLPVTVDVDEITVTTVHAWA